MIKFTKRYVSKLAIAVVIGGVSMVHAVYADETPIDPTVQASGNTMKHKDGMKRVDERIKELHDTLNITADQEPQWKKVSDVMRKNEASIRKLVEARQENESANAIDDLKSYESITQAHERGLKKLIPVFEEFYKSLTPEQKASADDMFGKYEGRKDDKGGEANPSGDNGNATTPAPAPADSNTPTTAVPAPGPDDSK